jgi:hypothetical protein
VKAFSDYFVMRDYKGQLYAYSHGLPKPPNDLRLRRIKILDERRKRPFIEDFAVGYRHVLAVDGSLRSCSQPTAFRLGVL